MSKKKAITALSKYMGYSNAAEFIRSHGEEGFTFLDNQLQDSYIKNNQMIAKQLENKAMHWQNIYESYGIEIDCSEEDYH